MKAILIDAVKKTVSEVECDGKLETVYRLLRCSLIDVVSLPHLDTGKGDSLNDLFVDDEGLLTATDDDSPFIIFRNNWTFAGSGLIVGQCDEDGNTTETTLTAEFVRQHVVFASLGQLRAIGAEPNPQTTFVWLDT